MAASAGINGSAKNNGAWRRGGMAAKAYQALKNKQ